MKRKILYVQYTNPAAYPPLEHSSVILSRRGWRIRFLGTMALGSRCLALPAVSGVDVKKWRFCPPGPLQKIHYALFNLWILLTTLLWRPGWIYASDPLAAPVAVVLHSIGVRILYHEHDTPLNVVPGERVVISNSIFERMILRSRNIVGQVAELCLLPSRARAEAFQSTTGRAKSVFTVFNCPRREEAAASCEANKSWTLYYHGNISADLLPLTILGALKRVSAINLLAIGYTTGDDQYPEKFWQRACELGLESRVDLLGPRQRTELLVRARKCTIGWAAMPMNSANFNFQTMAGASNKAFDYLACGLAILVSNLPDWNAMFVTEKYALSCDPGDSGSIAAALQQFVDQGGETCAMGDRGRQRILEEWNYETQFEPVLQVLEAA